MRVLTDPVTTQFFLATKHAVLTKNVENNTIIYNTFLDQLTLEELLMLDYST